jgi:hypothetical protein
MISNGTMKVVPLGQMLETEIELISASNQPRRFLLLEKHSTLFMEWEETPPAFATV